VGMLSNMHLNYFTSGRSPGRWGNAHPSIVPYQVFASSDGHIILAAGNDAQFRKFCDVAGRAKLAADPRFATNDARVRNREELVPILERIVAARGRDEWVSTLEAAGVPCGPINSIAQVFEDPQVRFRGMKVEVPHPVSGTVPLVRNPIRLSETPIEYGTPPPMLGEHTDEVLQGVLGMSREEIARLREQRVL
jgi:crotonobetainyl-CoA:carnitine CoA-transferase CaiB-like acyl-CoA transferase